jgi:hypothetical protein
MRRTHWLAAILVAAACAGPCLAEPLSPPAARLEAQLEALERGELLRGLVTEQDVTLLFDHLRAALLASATGGKAPPADELNRRAEAIGRELKARGWLAGLLLLNALESHARELAREAPRRPPPVRPDVPMPY